MAVHPSPGSRADWFDPEVIEVQKAEDDAKEAVAGDLACRREFQRGLVPESAARLMDVGEYPRTQAGSEEMRCESHVGTAGAVCQGLKSLEQQAKLYCDVGTGEKQEWPAIEDSRA